MAKFSVPAVLEALSGDDDERRDEAMKQLDKLPLGYFDDHPPRKRDVARFVPQLAVLLTTHRSPQVRDWCAQMIGESGIPDPSAIQALTRALKDQDRKVVRTCAWALGALREHASDSVPDLLKQLKHPWMEVRWRVCWAIAQIGGLRPRAAKAMVNLFADEERQVRAYAVEAFGSTAAPTPSAFRRLEAMKSDSDPFVAGQAHRALATLRRLQGS
jgi:HEAT repeat protein